MEPKRKKHHNEDCNASEPAQQHMASYFSQNPASNPAILSSGSIGSILIPEEVRIELQDMFQKFQEDIRKKLLTKRSLKMKVNASFKSIWKKWDHVLKEQHELRMNLYGKDIQEMISLFLLSNMQLDKLKEEAENLATLHQKQKEAFQQSLSIHSQKIEVLENLYDLNFKECKETQECNKNSPGGQ
ncbi:synaptonemal complex protein 3-like [Dipodomys merriami]|uniref:synaptonemal complex protein 3-like n=1 Tax=Dipodomys merriami TaxID=94247 RepID=UPI0038558573